MWLQTHLLAQRGVYNIFFLNEFFASMFSEESEEPGEKQNPQIWLLLKNRQLWPPGSLSGWSRGQLVPWSPLLPTASYRGHVFAAMTYVQIPTDLWAEDAGHTSSPAPSCSVQNHTASTSAFAFPSPTLGWHLPCPLAVAPLLCCFCFLSGRQVAELPTNPPAGGG